MCRQHRNEAAAPLPLLGAGRLRCGSACHPTLTPSINERTQNPLETATSLKKAKPSEMELFEAHRGFSLTIAVVCQIVWLFTQDGPWLPIAIFFCLLGIRQLALLVVGYAA